MADFILLMEVMEGTFQEAMEVMEVTSPETMVDSFLQTGEMVDTFQEPTVEMGDISQEITADTTLAQAQEQVVGHTTMEVSNMIFNINSFFICRYKIFCVLDEMINIIYLITLYSGRFRYGRFGK